jgi:hypothetical protein
MKKIKTLGFLLLVITAYAGAVYATSLTSDIQNQGRLSYISKTLTDQQLATSIRDYEDVTGANTLVYGECGKTMFLNSATEFATTLPTPVAGCYFKFVVKAAPSGASYTIVTASSANILIGGINELEVDTADDGPYDNNGDTITLVDGLAVVGDYVEMFSDGTSWYLTGQTNADGGATVTGT